MNPLPSPLLLPIFNSSNSNNNSEDDKNNDSHKNDDDENKNKKGSGSSRGVVLQDDDVLEIEEIKYEDEEIEIELEEEKEEGEEEMERLLLQDNEETTKNEMKDDDDDEEIELELEFELELEEIELLEEDDDEDEKEIEHVTRLFAEQNLHEIPLSLKEMTSNERTEAMLDLHGALDIMEETSELIQSKLLEFDKVLEISIPMDDDDKRQEQQQEQQQPQRLALDKALQLNRNYVKSLRLAFLRAERFHVEKAMIRMMEHFTMRVSLFGKERSDELLSREIQFSDFQHDERDMVTLKTGIVQLCPYRDRVGRAVVLIYPAGAGKEEPPHLPSMMRVLHWMYHLAGLMGKDVQQKGCVSIWYGVGIQKSDLRYGRGERFIEIASKSIVKINSFHACYDDPSLLSVMTNVAATVDTWSGARLQTHWGTYAGCLGNLVSFGIPREILPISSIDGTMQLEEHYKLLRHLERKEKLGNQTKEDSDTTAAGGGGEEEGSEESSEKAKATATKAIIESPGPKDILLGRGRRGVKNSLLQQLLEKYFNAYNTCQQKIDKTCISYLVLTELQEAGCRFLMPVYNNINKTETTTTDNYYVGSRQRQVPCGWKVVSDDYARERIGHAFRNLRTTTTTASKGL